MTTVMSLAVPVFASDSLTISCYTKAEYLSDLADVADVTQAARLCNDTYADREGRCIGCFNVFDSDKDICIDNLGRKVLR